MPEYPHPDGDVTVLGPEIFASKDGEVICWQGENYVRQAHEVAAVGYLSAELAARADAWNGNAPDWFPQPPEWLELWEAAKVATADVEDVE